VMASAPVRVVVGAGLNRDGEATLLRLAHPATGAEALFLLTPGHELLELNFVKNEHTSWFIGDAVAEGASRGLVRLPNFTSRPQTAACTLPRRLTPSSSSSLTWSRRGRRAQVCQCCACREFPCGLLLHSLSSGRGAL